MINFREANALSAEYHRFVHLMVGLPAHVSPAVCVRVFRRFGFAICAVGFPLNLAKCAPFHIEHHQPAINTRDELLEDAERFHMQANAYALEIPLIAALLVLQALSETFSHLLEGCLCINMNCD